MRVMVIRHHAEDTAGFIGAAFEARGAGITTHLFPDEGPLPAVGDADHLIVLGAVPSVYDDGPDRAWIAEELAWLRRADEAGVPVFGICFGAQSLCAALGGRVTAAARKEVGWTAIDSYDPDLVPVGPWLEFHGDTCLPPAQAKILARNQTGVQAFTIGRHLAVQFHPEVDTPQLQRWLDAGAGERVRQAGQDPDAFLAETVIQEPAAAARADQLVAAAILLTQREDSRQPPAVLAEPEVSCPPPTG
jgi:GMP synthase-like glutamine amidotransferase